MASAYGLPPTRFTRDLPGYCGIPLLARNAGHSLLGVRLAPLPLQAQPASRAVFYDSTARDMEITLLTSQRRCLPTPIFPTPYWYPHIRTA